MTYTINTALAGAIILIAGSLALLGFWHAKPTLPSGRNQELRDLVAAAIRTSEMPDAPLNQYKFIVPHNTWTYDSNFTFHDLVTRLKEAFPRPAAELSSSMGVQEFMKVVAKTVLQKDHQFRDVGINTWPRPGVLTILLVAPKTMNQSIGTDGSTCYYLGFADVVVCNVERIAEAFARIDAFTQNHSLVLAFFGSRFEDGYRVNFRENIDDVRALLRQNFIVWLVGHEIGHAVLHRNWTLKSARPLHFDLSYDTREREADLFVVEHVRHSPTLSVSFAPLLLEYVEHEFRRLYKQRKGEDVELDLRSGQPENALDLAFDDEAALLLRAFNILNAFIEQDPDAMRRMQIRPAGGRFGFVHSLKGAEHVRFIGSKLKVEASVQFWKISSVTALSLLVAVAGGILLFLVQTRSQGA